MKCSLYSPASERQSSDVTAVVVEHSSTSLIVPLNEQEIYRIRVEDKRGGLGCRGFHVVVEVLQPLSNVVLFYCRRGGRLSGCHLAVLKRRTEMMAMISAPPWKAFRKRGKYSKLVKLAQETNSVNITVRGPFDRTSGNQVLPPHYTATPSAQSAQGIGPIKVKIHTSEHWIGVPRF